MKKLTLEELNLQILSTCLLINTQGKWHAFYSLSAHVGKAEVRIVSSDNDYQTKTPSAWSSEDARFTSSNQHQNPDLTEEVGCQRLIKLLAWTQRYLSMEAAA